MDLTFANIGPLPTSFTAPSSCTAKPTTDLFLAPSYMPWGYMFGDLCDENALAKSQWVNSECYPSGSAYNKIVTDSSAWPYYSPASSCPPSWSTVGKVTKGSNGHLTSSGIFTEPAPTLEKNQPALFDPVPNEFMNVLPTLETAIACCPSGFTGRYVGNCYSTLPYSAYTKSTACVNFFVDEDSSLFTTKTTSITYYDRTVKAELVQYPTNTESLSTTLSTTKLDSSDEETYVAVVFEPMMTLVHGGNDDEATKTGENGPDNTSDGSGSGDSDADSRAVRGVDASGTTFVMMMSVWGVVSFLAGIMLL